MKKIPEFALIFLENMKKEGKKESTITRYYLDLCFYFDWLEKQKCAVDFEGWKQLEKEVYERFYEDCKEKYVNSTVKRIRTVVSALQRYYEVDVPNIEGLASSIIVRRLHDEDFATEQQFNQLIETMATTKGLSDKQIRAYPFLATRNQSIAVLFYHYGLRVSEIHQLMMKNVNFGQNELTISKENEGKRVIKLSDKHTLLLRSYFMSIPERIRPYDYSSHPLFVSFNFEYLQYTWNYEKNSPQRLSTKAIQKMMKQEIARADLPSYVSTRTLRNSCILRAFEAGATIQEIQQQFGFENPHSLYKYEKYMEQKKEPTLD